VLFRSIEEHDQGRAHEAMINHIEKVEENVLSSKKSRSHSNHSRLEERSIS